MIETNNAGTVFNPRIAIDASGNAIAVWDQMDGALSNIYANRFTAATNTWGNAVLIETDNAGHAWAPRIAIDANGNALAVWSQFDGTSTNIYANRFTAASNTWGGATLIETDNTGDAYDPQIAIDANGNALAAWRQSDGARFNVWANRFTGSSNTWGSAVLIETDNAGHAHDPRIAIDPNGNALAVWSQDDDNATTNVWANRFAAASNTWGSAQLLEGNPGDAGRPQIAVDANGDALAVWFQFDGARSNLWGNRFGATSNNWSGPVLIESSAGSLDDPQVAIGTNGNALIVWSQSINIWAKRFTSTSNTWGAAALIELSSGDAARPRIAIDANGNAMAVWSQSDGTRSSIWGNRFTAAQNTWDSPNAALIEANNAGDAFFPEIAIAANGNALAIWRQSDGTRDNVWAARFD